MDESNIPIDINIGKLQDWLVSRRHVSKDWQKNVLAVREKINNAIQDMPAHEGVAALLSGSHINYFHCLKIIDILKETEADSKNMFGRYGSQRMKDWQDVVRQYERDGLYLAEAAQILVRNINYEIPSLKRQIAKLIQSQAEAEKKSADYLKNEASTRAEFQAACKQLGIRGENIKRELVELLKELPDFYREVVSALPPIAPAVALHAAFREHAHGGGARADGEPLPLLRHVLARGDTTVYEWTYGEPPLSVEPEPVHVDAEDARQGAGDQIDFGEPDEIDFGCPEAGAAEVDFGDGGGGGEIDWGGIGEVTDDNIDLDMSSAIESVSLEESGIVVEAGGTAGGAARGREALSVLDHPTTRGQLIAQLMELESFLKMRLYEASAPDGGGFSLVQELPTETAAALAAMLNAVQLPLARLRDVQLSRLHNVKHSPRYADVLSAQLRQKLSLCEKLRGLAARAQLSAGEACARGAELRPLLARIVDRSRELQREIEVDISKKYKGRPVNIIGGVKFL